MSIKEKLGIICIICLNVIYYGYSKNIVKLWDFEEFDSSGRPSGWSSLEQGIDMDSLHNQFTVSPDAYQGKGSAMIKLETLHSAFTFCFVEGIKPNTWYCLSVWMKSDLIFCCGKGPTIFCARLTRDSTPIGNTDLVYGISSENHGSSNWVQMRTVFKTPDDTKDSYVGLGLYNAQGTVWFDNLCLEEISEGEAITIIQKEGTSQNLPKAGENLIMNGSFEVVSAPEMPDCWYGHCRYSSFDPNFRENYRVVNEGAFHGQRCFHLKGGSIHYGNPGILKEYQGKGVLSMYLRSDDKDAELSVNTNGISKTFKPDSSWRQYVVNIPKLTSNYVVLSTKGEVFIDAVKLEIGDTPTPFTPNPYELLNPLPITDVQEPPKVKIKSISTEDTNLPWTKGFVAELSGEGGVKPSKKSICYLIKGYSAFYVRFECYGRKKEELIHKSNKHDDLVFADDSVALVINPGYESGSDIPYIFAVNSAGIKYDAYGYDIRWDGVWKATTTQTETGYIVEFEIPYACLSNGNFLSNIWQINLIRYSASTNKEQKEVSAWFYPKNAIVERTGIIVEGFDKLEKFKVRISEPKVLLAREPTVYLPSLFAVVFDAGFSSKDNRKGTAKLISFSGVERTTNWQSMEGKTSIVFTGLTESEVLSLGTFTLKVFEGNTEIISKMFKKPLQIPSFLILGPFDRNYYSYEKDAGINVKVNLLPQVAEKMELDLCVIGSPLSRVFHKRYPAQSGLLQFPVSDIPPGIYQVRVNLVKGKGGATIYASSNASFIKLPPCHGDYESKFNPITRMPIVNGAPFIFFGPEIPLDYKQEVVNSHLPHYQRDIPEISERFNHVVFNIPTVPQSGYTKEMLTPHLRFITDLQKAGVKVELWLAMNMETTGPNAKNIGRIYGIDEKEFFRLRFEELKIFKDHPNIVAWYDMDEMTSFHAPNTRESMLLDFYYELKNYDPYRLFHTNTSYSGEIYGGWDSTDAVGGSFYSSSIVGGYPPEAGPASVRGFIKKLEEERAKHIADKITGGWLLCWDTRWQREPTAEEMRSSIYLMLIYGARWINLYTYKPMSTSLWDGFVPLKKEIMFLTPVLTGKDVSELVECSNSYIDHAMFFYNGKYYLITVNFSLRKVTCSFDLTMLGKVIKVKDVFNSRQLKTSGGVFTDVFERVGRNVYEIEVE